MKLTKKFYLWGVTLALLLPLFGCGLFLDAVKTGVPDSAPLQNVQSGTDVVLIGNADWSGGSRSLSAITHYASGTLDVNLVYDHNANPFEPGMGVNDIEVLENTAYIVNSTAGSLQVLNLLDGTSKEFALPAGSNPFDCVVVSHDEVYISLYLTNQVIKLNPSVAENANPLLATLAMPDGSELAPYDASNPGNARPYGMKAVNGKLYVALNNLDNYYSIAGPGFVAVVDLSSFTVSQKVQGSGENMGNVAYFANFNSDYVFFISIGNYYPGDAGVIDIYSISAQQVIASWNVGGMPGAMVMDAQNKAYIKDDQSAALKRIDSPALTFSGFDMTYSISSGFLGGVLVDETGYLYIASSNTPGFGPDNKVYVYDTVSGTFIKTLTVGYNPAPMALWKAPL